MLAIFAWFEPLHQIAFPMLVLGMVVVTVAMLVGALRMLWPRGRLVVDGTGRVAYLSAGIGPLELTRKYATFAAKPTVEVVPRYLAARSGEYLTGHDVVLADARAELRVEFEDAARASSAAEQIRAYLNRSSIEVP
jgi:hypothetical protein